MSFLHKKEKQLPLITIYWLFNNGDGDSVSCESSIKAFAEQNNRIIINMVCSSNNDTEMRMATKIKEIFNISNLISAKFKENIYNLKLTNYNNFVNVELPLIYSELYKELNITGNGFHIIIVSPKRFLIEAFPLLDLKECEYIIEKYKVENSFKLTSDNDQKDNLLNFLKSTSVDDGFELLFKPNTKKSKSKKSKSKKSKSKKSKSKVNHYK